MSPIRGKPVAGAKPSLAAKLGGLPRPAEPLRPTELRGPLWEGAAGEGPQGGVTQSLLSRFLSCRERFRLRVVEGLAPVDTFNHRLEFGHLWHVCEEFNSQGQAWEGPLADYARALARRYPTQQEQVDHWYNVTLVTFPEYAEWWSGHPDEAERRTLLAEEVFDVPYPLPSGRSVRLRGKLDSVDSVSHDGRPALVLQENKTKGEVDPLQLRRQLTFDLQTMFYLVALQTWQGLDDYGTPVRRPDLVETPIKGVRYNVVRRPLSGGKGSIVRHKPTKSNPAGEGAADYYARLRDIIHGAVGPEWGVGADEHYFFQRWDVGILPGDIERFRREFLDPILEQMCDWWEHIENCRHAGVSPFRQSASAADPRGIHWRHPFGSVNWIDEGGSSDLDAFLESGSEAGLERGRELFGELKPV